MDFCKEGSVFQWRKGFAHKVDANEAAKVMKELEKEDNLNASSLVSVSKPEEAILHNEFEWDNETAGEEWRKHQARNMINSIVIVPAVEEDEPPAQPVRAFLKIEESSSNYESLEVILKSEDKTESLKKQALAELRSFQHKYHTILAYCKAESQFEQLRMKLSGIPEKKAE